MHKRGRYQIQPMMPWGFPCPTCTELVQWIHLPFLKKNYFPGGMKWTVEKEEEGKWWKCKLRESSKVVSYVLFYMWFYSFLYTLWIPFSRCLLPLEWNLMSTSKNIIICSIDHIGWMDNALIVLLYQKRIKNTKTWKFYGILVIIIFNLVYALYLHYLSIHFITLDRWEILQ